MNLQMKPPVVLKEHELAEQLPDPSQVADAADPMAEPRSPRMYF